MHEINFTIRCSSEELAERLASLLSKMAGLVASAEDDTETHLRFQSEHDFPEQRAPVRLAARAPEPEDIDKPPLGIGVEVEEDGCRCGARPGEVPILGCHDPQGCGPWQFNDNPEACPGCGSMPGDGPGKGCDDPDGCGAWKEVGA